MSATPPISAAQVTRLLMIEAISVKSPSLSPSRWRIRLKTGCLATAATRPLISEKTMIRSSKRRTPRSAQIRSRTRLGREDELADVDEAADRSHDPKRQLKRISSSDLNLLQFFVAWRRSSAGRCIPTVRRAAPGSLPPYRDLGWLSDPDGLSSPSRSQPMHRLYVSGGQPTRYHPPSFTQLPIRLGRSTVPGLIYWKSAGRRPHAVIRTNISSGHPRIRV